MHSNAPSKAVEWVRSKGHTIKSQFAAVSAAVEVMQMEQRAKQQYEVSSVFTCRLVSCRNTLGLSAMVCFQDEHRVSCNVVTAVSAD